MSFKIVKSDISKLNTDAIVNPTDQRYSGGGGVDKLLHNICGFALKNATDKLPKLHLGEAKATGGFSLPCKYIIHTSGPHWTGRSSLEADVLGSCYRNSITLAHNLGCKSIAFPLIASQGKHFPKELALTIAVNAIQESVKEYPDIEIILTVFGNWADKLSPDLFESVSGFIASSYIPNEEYLDDFVEEIPFENQKTRRIYSFIENFEDSDIDYAVADFIGPLIDNPTQANLDKIPVDEPFASMLDRLIKEKNISISQIQFELGMSSPGFWKIRTGKVTPSKLTVFGIAIALNLSIDETKELLMKAGYAINNSSIQDIVIAGLIQNKIYDRYIIDNLLYSLDLVLLPGAIID